jgi:hypothetical protein
MSKTIYSVSINIPAKDYSTEALKQNEALVLGKLEWDRITGHNNFLHRDAEYAEEQHRAHENLKEYSKFMIKDWQNTLQVRKHFLSAPFHWSIKI